MKRPRGDKGLKKRANEVRLVLDFNGSQDWVLHIDEDYCIDFSTLMPKSETERSQLKEKLIGTLMTAFDKVTPIDHPVAEIENDYNQAVEYMEITLSMLLRCQDAETWLQFWWIMIDKFVSIELKAEYNAARQEFSLKKRRRDDDTPKDVIYDGESDSDHLACIDYPDDDNPLLYRIQ